MKSLKMMPVVAFAVCAGLAEVRPVLLPERLDVGNVNLKVVQPIDAADWIWGDGPASAMLFRCRFRSGRETVRLHVSADNRYVLKLDGRRLARGPERGTVDWWTYRTLEVALNAGEHVLEAVVIRLPETFHDNVADGPRHSVYGAPMAQLAWRKTPGFVLKAEGRLDAELTTGGGSGWRVCPFGNVKLTDDRGGSFGIGASNEIVGNSPWFASPPDASFALPRVVRRRIHDNDYGCVQDGWRLYPTTLPPQLDEEKTPGRLRARADNFDRGHVYRADEASAEMPRTVPPHAEVNLLWDMEDYFCGYPLLETVGGRGARIEFGWAESLQDAHRGLKLNRGEFVGKRMVAFSDSFLPDGGTNGFTTTWWRSGRWLRLLVRTADEPLEIRRFAIAEVRYPTSFTARFDCDDATLRPVWRMCARTLQMCTHEMSFDCPFYEQQMYPGDTRIQLLVHGVLSADDRLARRDIDLFDASRRADGRIAFNYPSTQAQDGAAYTFFWPMMLADHARWHDNAAWLRRRFPGLLHTMEGLRNFETEEGLVANLPGWNFQDWADWPDPGCLGGSADADGTNAVNNLLYVGALKSAAFVADALEEPGYATTFRARAERTSRAILSRFWDDARGLLSDDLARRSYSEHAQALALTFDVLPPTLVARAANGLVEAKDLVRTTVYFTHYLFDAYAKIGRTDLILQRLDLWRGYVARGLKTAQEAPDAPDGTSESRSDCHAWSAHPIYHLQANLLGVRPAGPFFRRVRIAPQPGGLGRISAAVPSPRGDIVCELSFAGGAANGSVALPAGLTGEFVWGGRAQPLHPGANAISIAGR